MIIRIINMIEIVMAKILISYSFSGLYRDYMTANYYNFVLLRVQHP